MGPANASEILLTGGRFDANEALRMGLVNRVVAPDQLEATVMAIARSIASNAPLTVEALKAAIAETAKDPNQRDLGRVEELVAGCFTSRDYIEGRRAFLEKRPPIFSGR